MKKIISMVLTILVILTFILGLGIASNIDRVKAESVEEGSSYVEDISKKLIRFHVIANSDTDEDQELKLKVRDAVLEYIQPLLKNSSDINESREILNRESKKIIDISKAVIKDSGYDYSVEATLSKENFPIKTYGNITLPQGEYEAYRIIIGTGKGHNWWCVMFPPICFVDITKGQISKEETEKEMKRVLTKEEYEIVNNSKIIDGTKDNEIIIKSKLMEILKKYF